METTNLDGATIESEPSTAKTEQDGTILDGAIIDGTILDETLDGSALDGTSEGEPPLLQQSIFLY